MRLHRLRSVVSIAAIVAGTSAVSAVAQDASGGVEVGANVSPGAANARGEIAVEARPAVTAEDQLTQADSITRRANQLAARLTKMLDEARREKDIMRANCVNRKLTEVNANTRSVEQRSRALRDAASTGDEARRGHEYTVLTVLSQKLNQLDHDATQCLGQSVFEPGASQVVTTVPANAPSIDPSTVGSPPPPPPSVSVPPPISPAS